MTTQNDTNQSDEFADVRVLAVEPTMVEAVRAHAGDKPGTIVFIFGGANQDEHNGIIEGLFISLMSGSLPAVGLSDDLARSLRDDLTAALAPEQS